MKIERIIPEKPRFETIRAQHQFTEKEMVQVGQELGRKNNELTNAEAKKKEVTSQLKAEEDRIQAQITELAQKASNGYEFRDLKCEVKLIPAERKKQLIYNGEVKEEKTVTQDELQRTLPLPVWEYDAVTCTNPAMVNLVCGEWLCALAVWLDKDKQWHIGDYPPCATWGMAVDLIMAAITDAVDKRAAKKEKGCADPKRLWKEANEEFETQISKREIVAGEALTITAE